MEIMYVSAIVVGATLGIIVSLISRMVSRWIGNGDFWTSLLKLARAVTTASDGNAFLRVYGSLLKLLGSYLLRNAVQLAASLTPVVATVALLDPLVAASYNRSAVALAIHPRRQLTVEAGQARFESSEDGAVIRPMPQVDGAGKASAGGKEFQFASLRRNNSWCATEWGRLGTSLLGFDAHDSFGDAGFLILRPFCNDSNPLWPYLNDLEFLFYAALAITSIGTALFLQSRGGVAVPTVGSQTS